MSMMEPNLPRPESALARGIKITEFSGVRVNPEPVTYEESDILLEEYLSPYRLVGWHFVECSVSHCRQLSQLRKFYTCILKADMPHDVECGLHILCTKKNW